MNSQSRKFGLTIVLLFAVVVILAQPAASQQPAQIGVYYATLGNNGAIPGALITVDIATGAGTLVGATGIIGQFGDRGVPALAIKTNGDIYAMDIGSASNLYRIDALTGAATFVTATTLNSPPAIAFDGLDILWAADNTGNLYRVDWTTGSTILVGSSGVFIKGLAYSPIDGHLWASDASGGVFELDLYTAEATQVGNTGLAASADIHFDASGTLFASSGGGLSGNNLITIDQSTGLGQVIGSIGFVSVSGMASRISRVVPATVKSFRSLWAGDHIEVRWSLINIEGALSFDVSRANGSSEMFVWVDNNVVVNRNDEFVFEDYTTQPGESYRYRVVVLEDGEPVTSFETTVSTPSVGFALNQNHPNPFNPTTTFSFTIERRELVSFVIYDISGRLVKTLVHRNLDAGDHATRWDGRDNSGILVSSGVYVYRLAAGSKTLTRKAILLK